MIRRMVFGLAIVASMMGAGNMGPARAEEVTQPPDLTGQWRLDPKRSDSMERPGGLQVRGGIRGGRGGMGGPGGGPGGGPRGGPGGGPGGRGGRGAPPSGDAEGPARAPGASRPVRLPDQLHVTHTASMVSFEDSSGAVLQEITTLGGAKDTLAHAPGALVLSGQWNGGKLVVQRAGPGGGKATTTVTLEDQGELLVVRTKIEGSGDLPARELKRAYRRVKD